MYLSSERIDRCNLSVIKNVYVTNFQLQINSQLQLKQIFLYCSFIILRLPQLFLVNYCKLVNYCILSK